jgi:methyl-accepting chemotaxis protein
MKKLFKKLTISQTIIFLSTFLFSLQAIYGLIINTNLNTIGGHITQIETQYIPLTKKITLLSEHQLKQEIEFERAYRYALEINKTDNALKHFTKAKNVFLQLSNKMNEEIMLILNELAHDISVTENKNSKKQFTELTQRVRGFKSHHKDWEAEVQHTFDLLENDNASRVFEQSEQIEEHAIKLESEIISTLAEIEKYTENAIHELSEEDHNALLVGITLVSISLLMAIILTLLVTANLKEDLNDLKLTISNISEGDLLTEISSKLGKEFGLDIMRKHLQSTMLLVQSGANEILSASYELTEVSEQVMGNISQQAEELDLVSTAMTEMEATSIEVARHAENTRSSTIIASKNANESRDITTKAMVSMSKLTESLDQSSKNIQALDKHGTNISSVLTVIKAIAEQTNLLALNAAIEAARAGEQGRGFAVVADEVRTLAKRTQDSTIEIEEMINLFTGGTTKAVQSMVVNSELGQSSYEATLESNHKIEDIQGAMEDINDMNSQIATAAEEQSCTSQELSQNTTMISQLSAENVKSSARVSASSVQLTSLANQLKDKLEKFQLA